MPHHSVSHVHPTNAGRSQDKSFQFSDAEREFDVVFAAIKQSRGLAASYNIQQNLHGTPWSPSVSAKVTDSSIRIVYIRAEKDAEAELFQSQVPTFLALTKNCKTVEVVRDIAGVPSGCGSEVLTPTTFVHVLVRVCTFQCKHAA